jgi:hypothetical protein
LVINSGGAKLSSAQFEVSSFSHRGKIAGHLHLTDAAVQGF